MNANALFGLWIDESYGRNGIETLDRMLEAFESVDHDAYEKWLAENQEDIDQLTERWDAARTEDPYDFAADDVNVDLKESFVDLQREVEDKINEHLPEYVYAGWEGEVGGWGFWANTEGVNEDIRYGVVAIVEEDEDGNPKLVIQPDTRDVPAYAAQVNDHGNVTLYRVKVELEEVWSVV